MTVEASDLAQTIRATRPMAPAKDFKISKQFYCDLGFQPRTVRDWADNFVIHLYVSNLRPWWDRIVAADLATRYGVKTRAPHQADWGAAVAHLIDPACVLWWLHESRSAP